MIKIRNLSKFYSNNGNVATGISRVNLDFEMNEFVVILGESGSGKSTFLNVLGGYDTYEDGELYIDGNETSHYGEADYSEYRRKYVVNIFQDFNLVNSYTVYQNVELILLLNGEKKKNIKKKVDEIIDKVGLSSHRNTKASKLSGGQKQRVAIARALAKDAPVILADEPTGNLDSQSASEVVELLREISKEKLVIIVTHNYEQMQKYATRIIRFSDGQVIEDRKLQSEELETKPATLVAKSVAVRDIRPSSRVRLSLRNAFNIPIKFMLILAIFLFIVGSFFMQTSNYSSSKEPTSFTHYNFLLANSDPNQIIVKKSDGSEISQEEYTDLAAIANVTSVERFTLKDYWVSYFDDSVDDSGIYVDGVLTETIEGELALGREAAADNEIVIVTTKDIYESYGEKFYTDIMAEKITFNYIAFLDQKEFSVVGIRVLEEELPANKYMSNWHMQALEMQPNMLEKFYSAKVLAGQEEGNSQVPMKIAFVDLEFNSAQVKIQVDDEMEKGEIMLSRSFDYMTEKSLWYEDATIDIETIYNTDIYGFEIVGFKETKDNEDLPVIYMNSQDYEGFLEIGNYQGYVNVDHTTSIDEVKNQIGAMGFDVMPVEDTLSSAGFVEIMNIVFLLLTIGMFVVLLVIGSLVIGIILKSRVIYFNVLRMLGATRRILRQLIVIELIFMGILSYTLWLGTIIINKLMDLDISIFNTIYLYFSNLDYVINFGIVMAMSFLIGIIFSNSLFKKSTIKIMGEEK